MAEIDFCTLGMFIIDEIHFPPPRPPITDIIGGAGTYSALGARLVSPPPLSNSVGWIVDAGSDFPQQLRAIIESWDTNCLIRDTPERLTTRGWNSYGEGEQRAFEYRTPKLRLDHSSLSDSQVLAKSFHFICSPKRCIELVAGINRRRKEVTQWPTKAIYIWEPVPDLCIPEEFDNCLQALKMVDVISPNHNELGNFLGKSLVDQAGEVDLQAVQSASLRLSGQAAVVVRAGKAGCYVSSLGIERWFPAFFDEKNSSRVVDPTGGGNTFLGGFAVGLVRSSSRNMRKRLEQAVIKGSVAASFAIEQEGIPTLETSAKGETWNKSHVQDRLNEYERRLESYVQPLTIWK